jgi:hypothetical protein
MITRPVASTLEQRRAAAADRLGGLVQRLPAWPWSNSGGVMGLITVAPKRAVGPTLANQ